MLIVENRQFSSKATTTTTTTSI